MVRHLFRTTNKVFRPNGASNSVSKELISQKKLQERDTAWSTRKFILGWNLDTRRNLLSLPPNREAKANEALSEIPPKLRSCYILKWRRLLGIL